MPLLMLTQINEGLTVDVEHSVNPHRINRYPRATGDTFIAFHGESGRVTNNRTKRGIPFKLGEHSVTVGDKGVIHVDDLRVKKKDKFAKRYLRGKSRTLDEIRFEILPIESER